jgi:thiamine kinase-like enzyme
MLFWSISPIKVLGSTFIINYLLDGESNRNDIGPFPSEDDFNATLIDAYCTTFEGHTKPYITDMVAAHKHKIVFTHADFRPDNIMIKDGHVTGIIDWEMSGWYPEH